MRKLIHLDLHNQRVFILVHKSMTLRKLGRNEESEACFKQSIRLFDDDDFKNSPDLKKSADEIINSIRDSFTSVYDYRRSENLF